MALARTSTPCGVEVRAALLVLFPIFMGKHLAFHRWVWCWLWTFHRCLVSGWGNSLLFCLLSAFITNQDYTDVGEERMTADIGEGSASKWSGDSGGRTPRRGEYLRMEGFWMAYPGRQQSEKRMPPAIWHMVQHRESPRWAWYIKYLDTSNPWVVLMEKPRLSQRTERGLGLDREGCAWTTDQMAKIRGE